METSFLQGGGGEGGGAPRIFKGPHQMSLIATHAHIYAHTMTISVLVGHVIPLFCSLRLRSAQETKMLRELFPVIYATFAHMLAFSRLTMTL